MSESTTYTIKGAESFRTKRDIEHEAKEGAFWSVLGSFVRESFQFVFGVIMARILLPSTFGIYGIANLFTTFGSVIFALGLSTTIIQRRESKKEYLSTAYTLNISSAILLMLVVIVSSPFIAKFYNERLLSSTLRFISIGFLFNSLCSIHQALLTKSFQFKKLALISIFSVFTSGVAAVVCGFKGLGIWSLVIGGLILQAVTCVPTILLSGWKSAFGFDKNAFKDLTGFGSVITVGNLIWYLSFSIDHFLIGKYLGFFALGYYTRAFSLIMLPLQKITNVVEYVAFPLYARIQDNKELLQNGYLKASGILAFVTFPIICGLAVIAPEFITTIYGPMWSLTIAPVRILSLATLLMVVHMMAGSVFIALGKANGFVTFQTMRLVVIATAVLIGNHWGLLGACWAIVIANLVQLKVLQFFISKYVGITLKRVVLNLLPFLTLNVVMTLVTFTYKIGINLLLYDTYPYICLATSVIVGILAYLASIKIFRFEEVDSICNEIFRKLKEKTSYTLLNKVTS